MRPGDLVLLPDRIALGSLVRDRLTGFVGHAVARIEHLHGVPELKVVALRDGAVHSEWIDEARCVLADARAQPGFVPPCPESES